MTLGKSLIDKAAKVCGSYAQLAKYLGTSKQALSAMKQGRREISPETAALLADIAGVDPLQAMADAVVERNKTGPKAERIREILGKATAVGATAMLLFFYGAPLLSATGLLAPELTGLYIVLLCPLAYRFERCSCAVLKSGAAVWGVLCEEAVTWGVCTPIPPAPTSGAPVFVFQ